MLEIKNVSVRFSAENRVQAVDDVTLSVGDGQKTAIVGETGSGKSVLLMAVLRLLPKTAIVEGSVRLNGEDLFSAGRRRLNEIRGGKISYVPQGGGGSMNPLLNIGFQVGEPLMEHRGYSGKKAFLASIPLLRRFNLGNEEKIAKSYPHELSGGMRQRAMVAMGTAGGSGIILADEPTKGLDGVRLSMVAEAFESLDREALLCVTHDLKFARRIADSICVMYAGEQIEYGEAEAVFGNPLHPYTQAMIRAMPENGMKSLAGYAQENSEQQAGCRFASRCPYASEACATHPDLYEIGNRKVRCVKYADRNQ